MSVPLLDILIRVKVNTDPYDSMDLSDAYQFWLNMANERDRYNIGVPAKKTKLQDFDDDVERDSDEIILNELLKC